jgi:ketosteroid isomerase-like protein
MSQENVEVVRRGFEHLMRTGEPPWHAIDPNVQVRDHDTPDQTEYRGHDGLGRWIGEWSSAWERWAIEPQRFVDAGDRVVAIYRVTVEGKGSGLVLDRQEGQVWQLRHGMAVRVEVYSSGAEALAAVGLEE